MMIPNLFLRLQAIDNNGSYPTSAKRSLDVAAAGVMGFVLFEQSRDAG